MTPSRLERVAAELDLWEGEGRLPAFWIRDDDAIAVTDSLERLGSIAARYGVKVGLAFIAGLAEPDLIAFLRAQSNSFFPMCHGWKHVNHASPKEPAEFGEARPLAEARVDTMFALQVFHRHFAAIPAVFVPPFGRISMAVIDALPAIGFVGLSGGQRPFERRAARIAVRFGWVPAVNIASAGPLPRIDAHIDLIDWRSGSAQDIALVADWLVGQLRLRRRGFLPARTPVGLLTHHRVHDERIWQLLESLIDALKFRVDFIDIAGEFAESARVARLSLAARGNEEGK
jgi:hypothetical protein